MTVANEANILAGYISDKDLAKVRNISERTLRLERQSGNGPPFAKIGSRIFYPTEGFRAWLASRVCRQVRADRGKAARG